MTGDIQSATSITAQILAGKGTLAGSETSVQKLGAHLKNQSKDLEQYTGTGYPPVY